MSILIALLFCIPVILISKMFFQKWVNHLSIYIFSWGMFVILYELKLIRFIPIKDETWIIIVSTSLIYIMGVSTVILSRKLFNKPTVFNPDEINLQYLIKDGKYIFWLLIIFSVIGLLVAIQHWMVLIGKFGSIPAVLIRANLIYRLRIEGEISGTIPYLNAFSYAAIFLAGIYTAYKGKLTFSACLPLIAVILQDMASVGRAGIFLAFLEFGITFILYRHYLTISKSSFKLKKWNLTIAAAILLILFIGSSTLIKNARGTVEEYRASTKTLNTLNKSNIISPSIYFYFSSNVGVLSKYFESGGEDKLFGENTFLPVYNLLSKFEVVEHPGFYPRGYFIPIWTNSATYIRELHEDFGFAGVFIVPYFLGLITTFFWFRFYEKKNVHDFIILVYLYLIIAFSTFYMVTRAAVWPLSLIILIITFACLHKFQNRYSNI